MFTRGSTGLDALLDRHRPSPWREFWRAPCMWLASALYCWQTRIEAQPLVDPVSVVCVSDTHNSQPQIPDGDVLVHAGDLTQSGTFHEIQAAVSWLKSLPHPHKIVVAGNHDILLDSARDDTAGRAQGQRQQLDWGDVVYLENGSTTVVCSNGRRLRVYGSPLTPKHGNWAFQYPRSNDVWTGAIPEDTDILITHGPPRAHLDLQWMGCVHLLRELWRVQPLLHVFGHVHAGYGSESLLFDQLQRAFEQTMVDGGGTLNLLRVAYHAI